VTRPSTPLAGRSIVVTRAAEQAGSLVDRLRALGASVVEVPTIEVVDPLDGGAALRRALADVGRYRWLVVTSVNGAERLVRALPAGGRPPIAAVGPGTAAALQRGGARAALVPRRAVAEGLLDEFPRPPAAGGWVLLAQAEAARPVLAEGLRAAGWQVETAVAYRTSAATPAPEVLVAARSADAVTFTSGSTVRAYLDLVGTGGVPPVVVSIGPVTSAAAAERGVTVTRTADPHTLDGLVEALVAALG
jgi:uroporphyrinogen-III synthase